MGRARARAFPVAKEETEVKEVEGVELEGGAGLADKPAGGE